MHPIAERVAQRTMNMNYNVDGKGSWDWGAGVALYGLRRYFENTRDQEVLIYIKKFVDFNMDNSQIQYTVNTTVPLMAVMLLYRETGNVKYLDYCEKFAKWLMFEAPKTQNGEMEHTVINHRFTGEVWVDTVFMVGVFLTQMSELTGNKDYMVEGIKQVRLHIERLQDYETGLLYHGYSYEKGDYKSGCLWARGNSWVTLSIPEIYKYLEEYPEDKKVICERVNRQIKGIVKHQGYNGLWPTILTDSTSYHETSASAGFVYGILKGIELGYVSQEYKDAGVKGYNAVVGKIAEDGMVLDVSHGTGIQDTVAGYNDIAKYKIMPWGQGIALLMLCENTI